MIPGTRVRDRKPTDVGVKDIGGVIVEKVGVWYRVKWDDGTLALEKPSNLIREDHTREE